LRKTFIYPEDISNDLLAVPVSYEKTKIYFTTPKLIDLSLKANKMTHSIVQYRNTHIYGIFRIKQHMMP